MALKRALTLGKTVIGPQAWNDYKEENRRIRLTHVRMLQMELLLAYLKDGWYYVDDKWMWAADDKWKRDHNLTGDCEDWVEYGKGWLKKAEPFWPDYALSTMTCMTADNRRHAVLCCHMKAYSRHGTFIADEDWCLDLFQVEPKRVDQLAAMGYWSWALEVPAEIPMRVATIEETEGDAEDGNKPPVS